MPNKSIVSPSYINFQGREITRDVATAVTPGFPRRLRYSQATKMPVNHAALRPINQETRTVAARGPWFFPIETQSMGSCLCLFVSGSRERIGRTKGSKPTRPNSNLWLKLSVPVGA